MLFYEHAYNPSRVCHETCFLFNVFHQTCSTDLAIWYEHSFATCFPLSLNHLLKRECALTSTRDATRYLKQHANTQHMCTQQIHACRIIEWDGEGAETMCRGVAQ